MAVSRSGNRLTLPAWCLYDWANSAFTTLVVTFVYGTYFSGAFAGNEGEGTALWSRGIVVSSLLVAVLAPLLGALADQGGRRRKFLTVATLISVAATVLLTFVEPGSVSAPLVALVVFVVANVAFETALVFYNSFLPSLAPKDRIGRISGIGWGLGYAGGLVSLVLALFGFVGLGDTEPLLSLNRESGFHVRATNLLVAGWFLLFSLPALILLRDDAPGGKKVSVVRAFRELGNTFRHLRHYRDMARFLVARLIYNDGLVTVFAFGGIYAAGTFGMTQGEVIVFAIALNVAAGTGAIVFGLLDDRLGGKTTILVSLAALAVASVIAVLAPTRTWFWVAGILIGVFAGPAQSASRSLMGRFVPENRESEFFGFFALSGKATAFLGPLLLGVLSEAWGQRAGVSITVLFFLVGAAILFGVNETRGVAAAKDG